MSAVQSPECAREASPVPSEQPGVSIVIPAYNEEGCVSVTLPELTELMASFGRELSWEIIVVEDGSTDGTREALRAFEGPELRVIAHPENRGYGAALKTGIAAARHEWILITDADATYPASHVPELLARRQISDMVVGARVGRSVQVPLIRRPAKWVLRRLAAWLSRSAIPDLNSGLRVFRRALAQRYARLLPDGFSYTSTITIACLADGQRVEYIPIDYRHREGRSKIRPISDTLNFVRLLVRTIMFFDPMRVLLPVSLGFLAASLLVATGSYLLLGRLMDVTTVLLFVTGVQLLVLGMITDVINRRLP